MIRENRQLVTDEAVEFEKYPVEVQDDCRKITDHFRGKPGGCQYVTGWTCKHYDLNRL